ncbi:Uncharacterised protein [Legionella bozemanae]|nr:Uncharacterised protein [Legionella bozemanae]
MDMEVYQKLMKIPLLQRAIGLTYHPEQNYLVRANSFFL